MAASTHARGKATTSFEPMGPTAGGNLVCVTASHTVSAALSAGDVFQMIKVPHGAVIVDGYMKVIGAAGFVYEIGDGGDTARFLAADTVSASTATGTVFAFLKNGLPYQYSIAPTTTNQWDTIDVKVTIIPGASVVQSWALTVFYMVDDAGGLL